MLKFTNNKNNASSKNCMATLQVTARKQRITQIFLHSNSTVFTGRHADAAGAVAMGDAGGNNGLCIVFMTESDANFTFMRNNVWLYRQTQCAVCLLLYTISIYWK